MDLIVDAVVGLEEFIVAACAGLLALAKRGYLHAIILKIGLKAVNLAIK